MTKKYSRDKISAMRNERELIYGHVPSVLIRQHSTVNRNNGSIIPLRNFCCTEVCINARHHIGSYHGIIVYIPSRIFPNSLGPTPNGLLVSETFSTQGFNSKTWSQRILFRATYSRQRLQVCSSQHFNNMTHPRRILHMTWWWSTFTLVNCRN